MWKNVIRLICLSTFLLSLLVLASCAVAPAPSAQLSPAQPAPAVTFSVTPATGSYTVGDTFTTDLVLTAGTEKVYAIDVVLTYDPTLLEVVDADETTTGVQVHTTAEFESYPLNETTDGTVKLGAGSLASEFTGTGSVATVTFQVLKEGTATVSYAFEKGSTVDTDAFGTSSDADLLTAVSGATYTLVR